MRLCELISGIGVTLLDPELADARVCDMTEDSRTVLPGSLFVARRGTRSDGRAYIPAAVAAGAAAILCDDSQPAPHAPGVARLTAPDVSLAESLLAERFFGSPSSSLLMIGITGTNGKTTTAHLTYQMLNASGIPSGLIGTVWVDDGTERAEATLTTPLSIELSHTLSRMVEAGRTAAVMEVSSHALDQHRVAALQFDVGVFTNITGDHLDYHGSMENYLAAKAKLFQMLPPEGTAVINVDDPRAEQIVERCRARVLRCTADSSRAQQADCHVRAEGMTASETQAVFRGPWGEIQASFPLIGRHNLMNALQAITCAHLAGVKPSKIRSALTLAEPPPGRLERVHGPGQAADESLIVLVDYAHTDDALANVLTTLRPLARQQGGLLRVVFGCGGDRDRTKRPRMAKVACQLADRIIVTSDNPRTEEPAAIIREILAGVEPADRDRVRVDVEREVAIAKAVEEAGPDDILLIAGKGHETYQLLPDGKGGITRRDFDDRLVAAAALERRVARHRASTEGSTRIGVSNRPSGGVIAT